MLPDVSIKAGLNLAEPTCYSQVVCLFGSLAFESSIPEQLPADDGFITPQRVGNLYLAIIVFLQYENLLLFLLGKLHVALLYSSYLVVR